MQEIGDAQFMLAIPFTALALSYFLIAVYSEQEEEGVVHRLILNSRFWAMSISLNAIMFVLMNYTGMDLFIKISGAALLIILVYDIIKLKGKSEPGHRNNLIRTFVFLLVLFSLFLTPQQTINKTFNNKNQQREVTR